MNLTKEIQVIAIDFRQCVQDNTCTGCSLPEGFDCNSYTPIRLYDLAPEGKAVLTQLAPLQSGHGEEIISIFELEDQSFELGVLTTYITELGTLLDTTFLGKYSIDWEHQPFDPRLKDVKNFCATHLELSDDYAKAKA